MFSESIVLHVCLQVGVILVFLQVGGLHAHKQTSSMWGTGKLAGIYWFYCTYFVQRSKYDLNYTNIPCIYLQSSATV